MIKMLLLDVEFHQMGRVVVQCLNFCGIQHFIGPNTAMLMW